MDIQFAYNLERMLYYVTGQNAELVDDIMTKVERQYQYSQDAEGVLLEPWLVTEMQKVFTSSAVTDEQTLSTIKLFYEKYNFLLCPHSAISVYGALFPFSSLSKEEILVCVLTAHPAKFETAIQKSLGFIPSTVEKVEMMKKIEPKFKWLRISSEDASVWRQEWRDTIIRDVEEVVSR